MIQLILFCLFCSFVICGLNFASEEGSVLHFLRYPFQRASDNILNKRNEAMLNGERCAMIHFDVFVEWIGKPLIMCAKCMASVWGTLLYWHWFESFDVIEWACCVLCISFFNAWWSYLYYKS